MEIEFLNRRNGANSIFAHGIYIGTQGSIAKLAGLSCVFGIEIEIVFGIASQRASTYGPFGIQ